MSELATPENLKTLASLIAASRKAKTPAEKLAAWDKHLTEIIERIAPEMAQKKMTTATATQMVEEIERLQNQIDTIYARANMDYGCSTNANVLRDAVKERKAMRDAAGQAEGLLASFDVED